MPLPRLTERSQLADVIEPLDLLIISDPVPVGDAFGCASARVRTTVRDTSGVEHAVVIKVWDHTEHGLGEIEFYNRWAPLLPIRLPALHGAHASDQFGVLVLEDLAPEQKGNAEFLFDRTEACAVARTLGTVHMATVHRGNDFPCLGAVRPSEWHNSRRLTFIERFGLPDDHFVRGIIIHSEAAEEVAANLLADATTGLIHGDVHQDNVVFVAAGLPVLLDWARPGWASAGHDLGALLVGATSTADYGSVIRAFQQIADLSDAEFYGAMLRRLVTGTLGIARWQPENDRQHRLLALNTQRVETAAAWLVREQPDLLDPFKDREPV